MHVQTDISPICGSFFFLIVIDQRERERERERERVQREIGERERWGGERGYMW